MSKRKPQSGFSMHELAGLIAMPLPTVVFKPKQDDIQKDTRTKHIRNIHTDKV